MLRSAGQDRRDGVKTHAGLRATAGLLSAVLLLLQLFVAGSRVEPPRLLGAEPARAGVTQNCQSPFHGEQPDTGRDHPHCCLLCEPGGRSDAALLAPVVADLPDPAASKRSPVGPSPDRPIWQPIGWTSSWSSRAPPAFS